MKDVWVKFRCEGLLFDLRVTKSLLSGKRTFVFLEEGKKEWLSDLLLQKETEELGSEVRMAADENILCVDQE